jgi:hypothetical protein
VNKPKPPVVKLIVVIKATWDEEFAKGIAIVNGDAGVEGSRASRPLAVLRIGGQQMSLFNFCEAAALNLDTSMANEFASLKARRFFLEAGSRPTTCARDSPSTSVLRRRRRCDRRWAVCAPLRRDEGPAPISEGKEHNGGKPKFFSTALLFLNGRPAQAALSAREPKG